MSITTEKVTKEKVAPVVGQRKTMRFCQPCKVCGKWLLHHEESVYLLAGWAHTSVERCAAAPASVHGLLWATDEERDSQPFYQQLQALAIQSSQQRWTFAKTMPNTPHFWILRKHWIGEGFNELVVATRTLGEILKFGKSNYYVLNMNEHRYWSCEPRHAPAEATELINRAVRLRYEPEPEPWFDPTSSWWSEPIEKFVIGQMNPNMARVLDVGGTCLNVARIVEGGYRAIGTPADMARVLAEHPTARTLHVDIGCFVPTNPEPFDLAIAGFGAGAFLSRRDILRMQYMTRPEGKVIVQVGKSVELMSNVADLLDAGEKTIVNAMACYVLPGRWQQSPL
jgi:hypothetical protein